jgi:predicted MPP superfamily phosphohydrolase
MSRTITWLHLSDLHAGNPTNWEAPQVTDTLLDDLQRLRVSYNLKPDLIFFTGDVAFGQLANTDAAQMPSQYEMAQEFFNSIRFAFGTPEIPQDNLFIVPGNHDINRQRVEDSDTQYLDSQDSPYKIADIIQKKGEQWRRFANRQSEYKAFLERYEYRHLLADPERLTYSLVREVAGLRVSIAGFNSAWSCARNREKGKLWLAGRWQLNVAWKNARTAEVSVVLAHHPVNWFTEHEDPDVSSLIENHFTFFLHGHEHTAWIDEKANGHTRIASAACYDRIDRENGYNVVRLDVDTGNGQIWLREFDKKVGEWKPRIVPRRTDDSGIWQIKSWRTFKQASSPATSIAPQAAASTSDPEPYPTHRKVYLPQVPVGRDDDLREKRSRYYEITGSSYYMDHPDKERQFWQNILHPLWTKRINFQMESLKSICKMKGRLEISVSK